MNRVYQLEFNPLTAQLSSPPVMPFPVRVFSLGNGNHDISGLQQALEYLNGREEKVVAVIPAGKGATEEDPRFLIITEPDDKAPRRAKGNWLVGEAMSDD